MKKKIYRLKYFFHNIEKYVWINVIVIILALFCISSLSIGYSILTKDLGVKSDVMIAADTTLRITKIDNFTSYNNGYEIYSPNINKLDLAFNVGLPSLDSTVSYNVTIRNGTDRIMQLKNIIKKESTNSNIKYSIQGLAVKDIVKKLSSITFTITFKYDSSLSSLPSETTINNMIEFEFVEYTKSYSDYVQDGMLLNLKGTNIPINNKWIDSENNKSINLKNVNYDNIERGYDFSTGGYGYYDGPLIPETGDFTLETMIKTPENLLNGDDMAIISQVNDSKNDDGRFKLNYKKESVNNVLLVFINATSKKTNLVFNFQNKTFNNEYYLLQVTRKGNLLSLYLNGTLVSEDTISANDKISQNNFKIGRWNDATLQSFLGKVFSVRLYNRALTNNEILLNKEVDYLYYGTSLYVEELKPYLLDRVVSNGDGLYNVDNEYIFKGKDIPNNSVKFKDSDSRWRIVSINSDNTMKLVNVDKDKNIPFDKSGYRSKLTSPYCDKTDSVVDTSTGDFYGCNAWEVQDGVNNDSFLNNYLLNDYYNSLSSDIKDNILNHDFYSGRIKDSAYLANAINQSKSSIWNSKIGLLTMLDLINSNNSTITQFGAGSLNLNNSWITAMSDLNTAIWTMTGSQLNSFDVWTIYNGNSLGRKRASRYNQYVNGNSTFIFYAFPVIYINDDVIVSGSGKETDPFIII